MEDYLDWYIGCIELALIAAKRAQDTGNLYGKEQMFILAQRYCHRINVIQTTARSLWGVDLV